MFFSCPQFTWVLLRKLEKKKERKKARREGGRKERSREGTDKKKRQERLAAMKAAGCVQAPGLRQSLGSWSGTPFLSSSRALSYCDVFCLLCLHMSPSRATVPNSRNSALSPLSSPQHRRLLNRSVLSSGCVHPQEESWHVQLAQSLWCLKIFPIKKKERKKEMFWQCYMAPGTLVLQPGMEPVASALEMWSLSRWREVSCYTFLEHPILLYILIIQWAIMYWLTCLALLNITSHLYPQIRATIASHVSKCSRFLESLSASPISTLVVSAWCSCQWDAFFFFN